MFLIKKIGLLLVLMCVSINLSAQKPLSGCWHPEDVKKWTPETDPNAKFNRSTVKIQPRFFDDNIKANETQQYGGQICNSTILQHQCSTCPSQGENEFVGYNPTYWQYMDKLVWWAGSASEGIIIPPSAPCIDIAHLNGVKILGQIFFPPSAYGGIDEWPKEILETKTEDNRHLYAKKLYEIARYFGFDGWFINEETYYGTNQSWADFIKDFQQYAEEDGNFSMEIQWYKASESFDANIMNSHKSTSTFLEYYSEKNIDNIVQSVLDQGFDQEDVFNKTYFGVQCVWAGVSGAGPELNTILPADKHLASVNLFCPEERIWKDNVRDLLNNDRACGEEAYEAQKKVFKNENIFWTNKKGDPSQTIPRNNSSWPGISGYIQERSVIMNKPFVSSFSAGLGKYRFVNGEKENTQDWYHRGMQTIMPTWRWWIENNENGEISINENWDDAYNMGTSFKVTGSLKTGTDYLTRLYKTKIEIEEGDKVQFVYKTNTQNSIELKLSLDGETFEKIPFIKRNEKNGWIVDEYDLSSFKNKIASIFALNFKSDLAVNNYDALLGQFSILPMNYLPIVEPVSSLKLQKEPDYAGGDLRIIWDSPSSTKDINHYNVYLQIDDKEDYLVGQTRGEAFYIPYFKRPEDAESLKIKVVSVGKDLKEYSSSSIEIAYPDKKLPEVSFQADLTYAKVGDLVTITAIANYEPEQYEWILPEGISEFYSGNNEILVQCNKEGSFTIGIKVTNSVGTTTYSESLIEVVSDTSDLLNVAKSKSIFSCSGSTCEEEGPKNIIDGETKPQNNKQKWCEVGLEHFVTVDLEEPFYVYSFITYDSRTNEDAANFPHYKISVSLDGENWSRVVNVKNNFEETKQDWIKKTLCRYVRLEPYADEVSTIRIWEFEVYGKSATSMRVDAPRIIKIKDKESSLLCIKYDLNGDSKKTNFNCELESQDNNLVSISRVIDDVDNNQFKVYFQSLNGVGYSNLRLRITNGDSYKTCKIKAIVDSDNVINILSNLIGVAYEPDNTSITSKNISGLTDGILTEDGFEAKEESWDSYAYSVTYKANENEVLEFYKVNLYSLDSNLNRVRLSISSDGKEWETISEMLKSEMMNKEGLFSVILPKKYITKYLKFEMDIEPSEKLFISEVQAFKIDESGQGINEEKEHGLKVFPNPIQKGNELSIENPSHSILQIVTMQGVVLKELNLLAGVNSISTSGISEGAYLLVFKNNEGVFTKKVIINE